MDHVFLAFFPGFLQALRTSSKDTWERGLAWSFPKYVHVRNPVPELMWQIKDWAGSAQQEVTHHLIRLSLNPFV